MHNATPTAKMNEPTEESASASELAVEQNKQLYGWSQPPPPPPIDGFYPFSMPPHPKDTSLYPTSETSCMNALKPLAANPEFTIPNYFNYAYTESKPTNNGDHLNKLTEMDDSLKNLTEFGESATMGSGAHTNYSNKKRKPTTNSMDDASEAKKCSNLTAEEKKIANLRKNIRDVIDENQLDSNTLAAQREESERLARVAEQQKIIREYQRQTVANRQYVRTQNRVLSILQDSKTFAKITDLTDGSPDGSFVETEPQDLICDNSIASQEATTMKEEVLQVCDITKDDSMTSDTGDMKSDDSSHEDDDQKICSDVVTIEDSSSDDDCILLSDDEDEEEDLDEEETEEDPSNSGMHVKDTYNIPDEMGRVVVNVGHPEGEEDIFIAPQIAKIIKPHQIGGVRFLFDNIIESTKRFENSSGFGCILAHSMGLGKTLQVVCFCDIFLRHTSSKTVLCVMPINTIQNWLSEFNMWIPRYSADEGHIRPRHFDVFVLNDQHKTLSARSKVVLKWAEEGGVLLIGYEMFRLLALKLMSTRKRRNKNSHLVATETESNKRLMESVYEALVKPGPDLVICDEGHRIKNANAGISLALKQIRTRRRIVLTGYPLQNNLLEYWCMVDFVRPNYLGTRTEFCNMFERPIQNGQCTDSTPEDIKLMRFRAHVLHSLLVGFVQRRSHVVLQQTLPQKLEYVILTRMTSFQKNLYDTFMNDVVRTKAVPNPLKAFAVCCKIWNHPDVLYNFLKKRETDLDLEIDDGEAGAVSTGSSTAPTTAAAGDTVSASNVSIPEEKSNLMKLDCSTAPLSCPPADGQDKTIESKPDVVQPPKETLPTQGQIKVESTSDSKASHVPTNCGNVDLMKTYDNIYPYNDTPYYPPSFTMPYANDTNGVNYWQDASSSYYMCHPVPCLPRPDFMGTMSNAPRQESSPQVTSSRADISSSEIVDLDTKEIKTVETNIDMAQQLIMKKEMEEADSTSNKPEGDGTKGDDSPGDTDKTKTNTVKVGGLGDRELLPIRSRNDDGTPYDWAYELMRKYEAGLISNSPKMELFFCILNEGILLGDRVLLFSQSLLTLNLIESFLHSNYIPGTSFRWARNVSYFRLDGSTTSQEREKLVNEFNANHNVKLFLISTRAGSLGINLVGANRVIVFDASWNPCHDTQAVYRIYRYGQKKCCFVYRIVMDKCLEKKIYDRQIKKQGMADRVVDECNPEAHLAMKDVTNLCHDFDDDKTQTDTITFSQPIESYEDLIMQKILQKHKDCLSKEPFHHDSLLVDRKEKKLSQAEKRQAHRGYELEKKASTRQNAICTINKTQYRIVRNDGTVINRPVASIRPMQTGTQAMMKQTNTRTTRWIPADVWQRQGMTAQEMTLPLDVVIPTNSSDKSNIILKAGQRVMVLKSPKGIYMQLDSGKIIAIRTSSKVTETNKIEKGEVIDITSDGDTPATEVKDASGSGENSNGADNTATVGKSETKGSIDNSYNNSSDTCASSKDGKMKSFHHTDASSSSNSSLSSSSLPGQKSYNHTLKSHLGQNDANVVLNPFAATSTQGMHTKATELDGMKTMGAFGKTGMMQFGSTERRGGPGAGGGGDGVNDGANASGSNHSVYTSSSEKGMLKNQSTRDYEMPHHQRTASANGTSGNKNALGATGGIQQPMKATLPIPTASEHDKYLSQSNLMMQWPTRPEHSHTATTKDSKLAPTSYVQPLINNQAHYNATASDSPKFSAHSTQKGEKKSNNEENKLPSNVRSSVPSHGSVTNAGNSSSSSGANSTSGSGSSSSSSIQIPQYPYLDHQRTASQSQSLQAQAHSKVNYNKHPQAGHHAPPFSSAMGGAPTHSAVGGVMPGINPAGNLNASALFPGRDMPYPQYYDSMYDNNMASTCDYPSQFSDYAVYGYGRPPQHYHSNFQANLYRNAPAPSYTGSNPYHMHFPQLPTSSSTISDHSNTMYPCATPAQSGNSQPNQWHH